MPAPDRALTTLRAAGTRLASAVRDHPRFVAGGSVAAAIAASVVRRQARALPVLPSAATVASDAAASVHNAAKASVIAVVREAEEPTLAMALDAVRQAIAEAAFSGVDVTAAALGAVEGILVVADDLATPRVEAGRAAAEAAQFAAGVVGSVAARRVGQALEPLLER